MKARIRGMKKGRPRDEKMRHNTRITPRFQALMEWEVGSHCLAGKIKSSYRSMQSLPNTPRHILSFLELEISTTTIGVIQGGALHRQQTNLPDLRREHDQKTIIRT